MTTSLPALYKGCSSVDCQQQQYLDIDPEQGKEVKSSLQGKNIYLGENIPQWFKAHTWKKLPRQAPALKSSELAPHPPKQRGA